MNNRLALIAQETLSAAQESLQQNQNDKEVINAIVQAARLIEHSQGRVIATGMGKSGLIARKVAATLTSTGTPCIFLHPADALHGDMGNIQKNEILIAFSNSGETRELLELLPHIKTLSGKLVAITQKANSTLANNANATIVYHVSREGCPLHLAPMASTTVALSVADALAAVLIKLKGFVAHDFGRFHPAGVLGKRLLTYVKDIMHSCEDSLVGQTQTTKELLHIMISSNLGAVLVTNEDKVLTGIVSDGDIKRLLDKHSGQNLWNTSVSDVMTHDPLTVEAHSMIEDALALMNKRKIYVLPVVDKNKMPVGIIRMHDLIEFV